MFVSMCGSAFLLEGFGTYLHALNSFSVVSNKLLHYPLHGGN